MVNASRCILISSREKEQRDFTFTTIFFVINVNSKQNTIKFSAPENWIAAKEKNMAKKTKELCKWKKEDISAKLDKFSDIVRNPKFLCTKCGRVADKKKWLHKPVALK
jgi:hypothetical protein